MGVPFSQMPDDLINDPDMTLSALRAWHVIYVETLGRPGWDLSYGQIAEKIGTKRRQTAMEAVTLLLDKGWLIRIKQKDPKGDDAPNLFAICREPHVPWNERQTAQGGTPDRTTGGALQRTHQKNHLPGDGGAQAPPPTPEGPTGVTRPLEFSDQSAAPVESKPRKERATKMPENYVPSDAMVQWTRERCPDIDPRREWASFINHHESKDSRFVRWDSAWRTWALRSQKWIDQDKKPDSLKPAHRSYRDKDGRTYE